MGWIRGALAGMKNNSATGSDGVGYRMINAVHSTRLGAEILGAVVAGLQEGYILHRWRDMPVVLILKLGRDLT